MLYIWKNAWHFRRICHYISCGEPKEGVLCQGSCAPAITSNLTHRSHSLLPNCSIQLYTGQYILVGRLSLCGEAVALSPGVQSGRSSWNWTPQSKVKHWVKCWPTYGGLLWSACVTYFRYLGHYLLARVRFCCSCHFQLMSTVKT